MQSLVFGDGSESVLILPSNGTCAAFYRRLGEALAQRGCSTTAVTLPGWDGTEPLDSPSWRALVEVCAPWVHALGPRGTLVGHSLGGMLAAQLAARFPVGRLVLMEPAITPVPALARLLARFYRKGAIDDGRDHFVNRAPGFWRLHDPSSYPADAMELALNCARTTDRATLHALSDGFADLVVPFGEVDTEVVLVRGESSGWLMHAAQRLLAYRLRARRVTLPRAGHWMANEADAALAEIITASPPRAP